MVAPAIAAAIPLLQAAAAPATTALMVGAARGAGGVIGKAAGNAVVDTASGIRERLTPNNSGQQRFIQTVAYMPPQAVGYQ